MPARVMARPTPGRASLRWRSVCAAPAGRAMVCVAIISQSQTIAWRLDRWEKRAALCYVVWQSSMRASMVVIPKSDGGGRGGGVSDGESDAQARTCRGGRPEVGACR